MMVLTSSAAWRRLAMAFIAGLGFVFIATTAMAQTVPSTVDPGRPLDAPIEEPELDDDFDFSFSIEIEGGISVPPGMEEEELDFEGMVVEGLNAYPLAEIETIWADSIGQTITYLDFFNFVATVTEKYKADGYILSFAFYPAQEVEDGIFTLQVIEGYVGSVVVKDSPKFEALILNHLQELTNERPLSAATLERELLLLNDLAGINATAVMRPSGEQRQASQLEIEVAENPWAASVEVNNRGTKSSGPRQAVGSVVLNSPFGYGEKFTFAASSARKSQELRFFSAAAEMPVDSNGGVFGANVSVSRSEAGSTLSSQGITSTSKNLNFNYRRPLIRSRAENWNLTAALDITHSQTQADPGGQAPNIISKDNLRALTIGTNYTSGDLIPGGLTSLNGSFVLGLPFLGQSDPRNGVAVSRADAKGNYSLLKGSIVHVRPIIPQVSMLLTGNVQYSQTQLFSAHEFGVGGQGVGRAFDASEITGDEGYSGLVEMRYNVDPADFEHSKDLLQSVQFYGFADLGRTFNIGVTDNTQDRTIASTGLGLRAGFIHNISLDVEVAKPLLRGVAGDGGSEDMRMFAFLRTSF